MSRPAGLGFRSEVALSGVGILTALMFRRVFQSWSYLPELVGAVLLPAVIGGMCRRLRLPVLVATLVSLVAGAVFLAWTLFPSSTAFGIPWAGTAKAVGHTVRQTWDSIAVVVAPVKVDTGFLFLAAASMWLLALAGDLLGISWELPLVGLLPWVSIVAVIGAVGSPAQRTTCAVLFLAAALGYLAVASTDERARRSRPLHVEGRRMGPPLRGVGVALGTLVLAVILTPSVPGFGSPPLVRYKNGLGPGDRVAISPLVDIKFRLQQKPPIPVFTVQSDQPAYWRVVALDDFNGEFWGSSQKYEPTTGELPRAPGSGPTKTVTQVYTISGLSQIWLPAAYAPHSIDIQATRVNPGTLSLSTDQETPSGLRYSVVSDVPQPTPDELRAAPARPDPPGVAPNKALPPQFPARVANQARRLTASATNRYDQVLALQDYLRTTFTYSLEPPPGHDVLTLERFLFDLRRGYCEQFAAAMAAMARSLGIPARVAVGFTSGRPDRATGTYTVTTENAHAWVEIYFPSFGWLQFDPTPTRNDPNPVNYNGTAPDVPLDQPEPTSTITSITDTEGITSTVEPDPDPLGSAGRGGRSDGPIGVAARAVRVLGVILLIPLFLAGSVMGAKAIRRRARLGAPAGARAQAVWREVTDLLVDAGLPIRESETALETARRAAARFGLSLALLTSLARAQYEELFSPVGGALDDSLLAGERDIRRALLSALTGARRALLYVNLASFRRRVREVAVAGVPEVAGIELGRPPLAGAAPT